MFLWPSRPYAYGLALLLLLHGVAGFRLSSPIRLPSVQSHPSIHIVRHQTPIEPHRKTSLIRSAAGNGNSSFLNKTICIFSRSTRRDFDTKYLFCFSLAIGTERIVIVPYSPTSITLVSLSVDVSILVVVCSFNLFSICFKTFLSSL